MRVRNLVVGIHRSLDTLAGNAIVVSNEIDATLELDVRSDTATLAAAAVVLRDSVRYYELRKASTLEQEACEADGVLEEIMRVVEDATSLVAAARHSSCQSDEIVPQLRALAERLEGVQLQVREAACWS